MRVMGKEWTRKHKIFLGITEEQPLPTCLHWPKFSLMADGASALLTSFQSWEMSNGSLQSPCCPHVQDRCGSLGLHRRKPRPTMSHGHRSGKSSWLRLADSVTAFTPDPVCYCTLPYMQCCECCGGLCKGIVGKSTAEGFGDVEFVKGAILLVFVMCSFFVLLLAMVISDTNFWDSTEDWLELYCNNPSTLFLYSNSTKQANKNTTKKFVSICPFSFSWV